MSDNILKPREALLNEGLYVNRVLPQRGRRTIGAWCFLDHLGPTKSDKPLNVGEHPHTALQTFTWMIAGETLHHDSLGNANTVGPGEINIMTAGHGIAHTEVNAPNSTGDMHAVQLWIALPPDRYDGAADFQHLSQLPVWTDQGVTHTLLVGEFADQRSAAKVYTPLVGLDLHNDSDTAQMLTLPLNTEFEYGIFVSLGEAQVVDSTVPMHHLYYQQAGASTLTISLPAHARVLLIGGVPIDYPVTMWWNFVGPDKGYIGTAFGDWQAQNARFAPVVDAPYRYDAPRPPWVD